MGFPMYQLFYDGEKPPELPNLPKRKSSDNIAWGKLILYMAQKMAGTKSRRPRASNHLGTNL